MQSQKFDYEMKFIMVGDIGVGKTSLINRFTSGQYSRDHQITIGVQLGSKMVTVNNRAIKLQIWDTAGQEQFKSVTRSYYRACAAALVVFDLTRKDTFRSVARWVQDIRNNGNKDVVLVLVGNKADLVQVRAVSRDEALRLSKDFEMLYVQTSAVSQQNVQRAFVWPTTTIIDKIEAGFIKVNDQSQSIKIQRGNHTTNSSGSGSSPPNCNCQC